MVERCGFICWSSHGISGALIGLVNKINIECLERFAFSSTKGNSSSPLIIHVYCSHGFCMMGLTIITGVEYLIRSVEVLAQNAKGPCLTKG